LKENPSAAECTATIDPAAYAALDTRSGKRCVKDEFASILFFLDIVPIEVYGVRETLNHFSKSLQNRFCRAFYVFFGHFVDEIRNFITLMHDRDSRQSTNAELVVSQNINLKFS
jgi:hypothetical protein